MFPGQINDNVVSHDDTRPGFSTVETGNGTEESPIEAATKNLSTFRHLLPHLTALTAKKQGRRRTREYIRFAVNNSEPASEWPLTAQPVLGFKLVGPKNGDRGTGMPQSIISGRYPTTWASGSRSLRASAPPTRQYRRALCLG
jgi:hypothetical protein